MMDSKFWGVPCQAEDVCIFFCCRQLEKYFFAQHVTFNLVQYNQGLGGWALLQKCLLVVEQQQQKADLPFHLFVTAEILN